eukprot:CAMPEP_0171721736 /NCGR_PEP_ID=MMETSP0991-20121206/22563_1 /TAXON_ID=483369 /ORGANISM="non described non described, Strain CCMP2098" /LENGTH=452 /DNA_ID=CAMNT_0012313715 /DNA_START=172 /DNA_END=1530 /DNA_ORIENTATION=+
MDKKKDSFTGLLECANCTATKSETGQPLSQKCARCKIVAYCSRECQMQHWKRGGHKKWCLTPKERSVQSALAKKEDHEATSGLHCGTANCPVCLEPIMLGDTDLLVTLACSHVYHISCIEELRSNALQQVCPLCRADLPSQTDDASTTKRCANCGDEKCPDDSPLVNCAKCKIVMYCGRDCQRAHWKNGGHKAICTQATNQQIAAASNSSLDFRETTRAKLFNAVRCNRISKVRQLLDQGAAVNQARMDDDATPLFIAAEAGHAKMVSLLVDNGAAVNQAATDTGATPLFVAALGGHVEIVRLLVNGGAAVNHATTDTGTTPLFIALGHAKVVRLLIDSGAAVNQALSTDGSTPLYIATMKGHTEEVRMLIDSGAAVNQATTDRGATPLINAAQRGHTEVVRLLINGGAAVNQTATDKAISPLLAATCGGHTEVASLLISCGATMNEADWPT